MTPDPPERTPIGFRLLLTAAVLYLAVRLVEVVGWVVRRL